MNMVNVYINVINRINYNVEAAMPITIKIVMNRNSLPIFALVLCSCFFCSSISLISVSVSLAQ